MGLKSKLASSILHESFTENPYLSVGDAREILSSTSCLLVDLTQTFYTASIYGVPITHRVTQTYDSIVPLASKEGGPIGELQVGVDGRVMNVVETFTLDQVAHVLMKNVLTIKKKWFAACKEKLVTPALKTIFLFVDGDSPAAKSETGRLRNTYVSYQRLIGNECDKILSLKRRKREVLAIVRSKMEPVKHEVTEGGGFLIEGSLRRFLRSKDNRSLILNHLVSVMTDSVHGSLRDVTIYLCMGYTESKDRKLSPITKLCGDYNHPKFNALNEKGIPYMEADVAIPYVWTVVRKFEKNACVLTKDSDFLITLLALADTNLHHLWYVPGPKGQWCGIYDNFVAFSSKEMFSVRNRLDLLLHLTVGGCDYVEGFPNCGIVALMKGFRIISENTTRTFFLNVNFVIPPGTDEIQVFNINEVTDDCSLKVKMLKDMVYSNEDLFCIRLGDHVYLLRQNNEDNSTPLQWYTKKCEAQSKSVKEEKRKQFAYSMKRRLYFLTNVTETRICLERDISQNECLARKCGYIRHAGFRYENKMTRT